MADEQGASIAFTKLIVSDLELTARFYKDVFQVDEIARIQAEMDGEKIDEIFLGSDGKFTGLCLFQYIGRQPAHDEVILGVSTDDIAALCERVKAGGGKVRTGPSKSEESGGRIMAFIEDPEGHVSEVMQET